MDPPARVFINRFQGGFPLAERPFSIVAAQLGLSEVALIQLVEDLLERGLLSRFGPLYDAEAMGGGLTLAAMSVPDPVFDRVAAHVNALPEVAHNYRRDHRLNMWFVVATETTAGVARVLERIEQETGLSVYDFPKRRTFYLGLWLALDEAGGVRTVPVPGVPSYSVRPRPLDVVDRRLVAATQAGLPLVERPYHAVGERIGVDGEEVIQRLKAMREQGIIRRLGAVPNHYRLGLRANGMTVWDVPDERVGELGSLLGRMESVSHCYERPRHPGIWPYNLFAMVHGHDRQEVMHQMEQIRRRLDDAVRGHEVLFSSEILKKTGLRLVA
ncbi:MAG: Lrp/AsnC family transcriptional regulator [Gammaproteobacteria bacterium]|nr:MAG: Lrp/AsnC family transcriptional regulator [Gammaproteobacteria bacterium]